MKQNRKATLHGRKRALEGLSNELRLRVRERRNRGGTNVLLLSDVVDIEKENPGRFARAYLVLEYLAMGEGPISEELAEMRVGGVWVTEVKDPSGLIDKSMSEFLDDQAEPDAKAKRESEEKKRRLADLRSQYAGKRTTREGDSL